ncbi:hypothetical protein HanRHA438_Chr01g0044021 [Helianthus annuus]|nr:hypothetical protein HanRHA438_Chr01g0044021 [Helianthus annuus]
MYRIPKIGTGTSTDIWGKKLIPKFTSSFNILSGLVVLPLLGPPGRTLYSTSAPSVVYIE